MKAFIGLCWHSSIIRNHFLSYNTLASRCLYIPSLIPNTWNCLLFLVRSTAPWHCFFLLKYVSHLLCLSTRFIMLRFTLSRSQLSTELRIPSQKTPQQSNKSLQIARCDWALGVKANDHRLAVFLDKLIHQVKDNRGNRVGCVRSPFRIVCTSPSRSCDGPSGGG